MRYIDRDRGTNTESHRQSDRKREKERERERERKRDKKTVQRQRAIVRKFVGNGARC